MKESSNNDIPLPLWIIEIKISLLPSSLYASPNTYGGAVQNEIVYKKKINPSVDEWRGSRSTGLEPKNILIEN